MELNDFIRENCTRTYDESPHSDEVLFKDRSIIYKPKSFVGKVLIKTRESASDLTLLQEALIGLHAVNRIADEIPNFVRTHALYYAPDLEGKEKPFIVIEWASGESYYDFITVTMYATYI